MALTCRDRDLRGTNSNPTPGQVVARKSFHALKTQTAVILAASLQRRRCLHGISEPMKQRPEYHHLNRAVVIVNAILALTSVSCGDSNGANNGVDGGLDTGPGNCLPGPIAGWQVDGASFSAAVVILNGVRSDGTALSSPSEFFQAAGSTWTISMIGCDRSDGQNPFLNIVRIPGPLAVGTYPLSDGTQASYFVPRLGNTGANYTTDSAHTGALVVVTADEAAATFSGTFSFTAVDGAQPGVTAPVTVTNGRLFH
jgi:hypothetical protein